MEEIMERDREGAGEKFNLEWHGYTIKWKGADRQNGGEGEEGKWEMW